MNRTDMSAQTEDIRVALDIGTTKVCVIVGRKNEYDKIEIIGFGKVASEGVRRGVVSNIDKTVAAIKEAVAQAERSSGIIIEEVTVGIAGQHIKSIEQQGILTRDYPESEITADDISTIIDQNYRLALPPGDEILHIIPQEYDVDNEYGVMDPIGMSGNRLVGRFHIITGQITASKNIKRCIVKAGLKCREITLEPMASAAAVLSNEEKEAGVVLIDIGGGTTDITIYEGSIIRRTAVIPLGGNVVTSDIKQGCTVMEKQAEKLKVRYGSALLDAVENSRIITIPGLHGRPPKEISEKNLVKIIQARVEEIMSYVLWEIKNSGYDRKLTAGMVLTGGGSLLKNLDDLAEYYSGRTTRVGTPVEHLAHGYSDYICSPIYSTAIGLLIHAIESDSPVYQPPVVEEEPLDDTQDDNPRSGRFIRKFVRKAQDFFEVQPDSELH